MASDGSVWRLVPLSCAGDIAGASLASEAPEVFVVRFLRAEYCNNHAIDGVLEAIEGGE